MAAFSWKCLGLCASVGLVAFLLWNWPVYNLKMLRPRTGKFLYFAYGSNLLTERIHINNPSAKKKAVARLKNYQLDFGRFSTRWNGAVATVINKEGEEVYGVLWELDDEHLDTLDKQEGVSSGIYRRIEVEVSTDEGQKFSPYTYELLPQHLQGERKPSWVYKEVIVKGAKENSLPSHYIEKLEDIEHNDYKGEVNVKVNL